MIDFIGDIHGHADKLMELLEKLGYSKREGVYCHLTRKVLFIGDYIDRGPKIREALIIVRQMVESGNAIALLGNHEYNALCFHHEEREGGHLRKHLIKNIVQHFETLKQFQNKQEEYEDYLEWFKTLPLYYETEDFRAVHACWDSDNITFLRSELDNDRLNDEILHLSVIKETELHTTIDETLQGKEIPMPAGLSFSDQENTVRSKFRIKWWQDPTTSTYSDISVIPIEILPAELFDISRLSSSRFYSADKKPVFFGHYWFSGHPELLRENICCLDYSVAVNGVLAAYSYDGEKKLSNDKFTFV